MHLKTNLRHVLSCPFQLVLDISSQLPEVDHPTMEQQAFRPLGALNSANDWINLESLGNVVPIKAQAMLDKILPYLSAECSLDVYLKDKRLTSDNLYTLLLLADNTKHLSLNLYDEEEWSEEAQSELSALFASKNTALRFLVCTEDPVSQPILHQLNTNRQNMMSNQGFDFSSDWHINLLIGYAWTLLKSGAPEVATYLLEHRLSQPAQAVEHASMLLLHLQIIRFHSHQYKALALHEYPSQIEGIDEVSVRYLHYLKAYAATLIRYLEIAERHFRLAGIDEHLHLVDEFSLYQLNIFALFNVHMQKTDNAFSFEKKIEQFIVDHAINSIGLKYVNFINIARLYKKEKMYSKSLEYYNKAYQEISQGGYTTSDHIYYHMNYGGVYEATGDIRRALYCWVNAALHWLVADNPYALAWRPKLILCREKTEDLNKPLILNDVVSFFCSKISSLAKELSTQSSEYQSLILDEHNTVNTAERAINFCLNNPGLKKMRCYASQGILVYSAQESCKPIHPQLMPLAHYLSVFFRTMVLKNPNEQTIVVDDLCDAPYAADVTQVRLLALLNGCEEYCFNEKQFNVTPDELKLMQSQITPSLSAMIASINESDGHLELVYKRDFLNKRIVDQQEIEICKALQHNDRTFIQERLMSDLPLLQGLIYKRVVSIHKK
ncbi:hypothetical protein [Legionella worsleiensis]|uniref:Tetratricopeptide repeat protein n=1 Tax=Legionella worsleiensis TaxID=45076 RepID=A0A0W1A9R4_9GAMM|nr:hypothetical protein [Legionella worsleiensis]KTD78004.1 hypothetical protein Lwor_1886 [Legionella worsleiensis]STY31509.1 Uncharacterised protein [Legionella worsleiensis]